MDLYKKYHVSIGSNIGDRLENIQSSLDLIHSKIASLTGISSIYESKSIGFDGDDFYNICASFFSNISPHLVMQQLLEIEKILGRNRSDETKYISRIIDIDILLIEDLVIDSEELKVPHPEMCNRRFVMEPLIDIDPNLIYPVSKISLKEIYEAFDQNQKIQKKDIFLNNPCNLLSIRNYNYIAIEGNIGSGKTSLSKQISADFNTKLMLERYIDNPFLAKFYENPRDFAFKLEMSFLADRYQQTNEDLSQLNFFNKNIISDYDIHKSLIFSKINLNSDEFNLYRKLFYSLYKSIVKPDLIIFLNQTIENLKGNIKKRGRDYEASISDEYLISINKSYSEFFKSRPDLNVKFIDVSEIDFVKNRLDYLSIINQID
jgi:2-amino-4-hydroxy-6-hydroxymethyldihydropteridine diphosphokinase